MLKIGITGGIGSGKSTVCKVFSILGTSVYHADRRAKILSNKVPDIRDAILKEFGPDSFANGAINNKYIAEIVFSNKEKLHKLNSIVHPFIEKDFLDWSAQYAQSIYVLEEAAILFESGASKNMDYNIVVNSPLNLRIQRITKRDGLSEEMILKRIQNQWSADKILALADWTIENDDKNLILPQILSIHNQLLLRS